MNDSIRVLHVFGVLNCGGAETMIMNIYRIIDRSQIQFDFVVHSEDEGFYSEEVKQLGGRIFHCPRYCGTNHLLYKKWWINFFRTHEEYSILHSHVRSTAAIIFGIAHKYNLVTIAHSHSTSNGSGVSSIAKNVLQIPIRWKADYFFGCSKEASKWLFGKKIINSNRFFTLQNAIDLDRFSYNENIRDKYREEMGISEKTVFIHVGNFREAKNHIFLLNLFLRLLTFDKSAVLLLVGSGELKEQISNFIKTNRIEDNIRMLGLRKDIPELLMASDCFLFPSKWEGLPVSVVEAQASGIPVLASDRITKDVAITELIHYLPIDNGYEPWLQTIMRMRKRSRVNTELQIKKAGFDVRSNVDWLTEFYRRIQS